MRRRILYVVAGIVLANLAIMVALYLTQPADDCDTSTRGLVAWSEKGERWLTLEPAAEGSELPPCRLEMRVGVTPPPG